MGILKELVVRRRQAKCNTPIICLDEENNTITQLPPCQAVHPDYQGCQLEACEGEGGTSQGGTLRRTCAKHGR